MTTLTDARSDLVALTTVKSAEHDFRIGRVISRMTTAFTRNFPFFFVLAALASLPTLFLTETAATAALLWLFLVLVFHFVSHAMIAHTAFQDMRGRPVNLGESLGVGLQRFFPVIGLLLVIPVLIAVGVALLIAGISIMSPNLGYTLGFILLVASLILAPMWYVGLPVCVVEQLGPLASLDRSSQLTKGHRWKIFGLLLIIALVIAVPVEYILGAVGIPLLATIGTLIWKGISSAFYATAVVATYHDLRLAKEGPEMGQLAAVFD
jgi:uncharacterized membrane protein